jgi:hypothetical protein
MAIINLFAVIGDNMEKIIAYDNLRIMFNLLSYIYCLIIFSDNIIFSVYNIKNRGLNNDKNDIVNTYLNIFSIVFLISSIIINSQTYLCIYFYNYEIVNPIYIITILNIIFVILLLYNRKIIIINKFVLIFINELTMTLLIYKLGDVNYL